MLTISVPECARRLRIREASLRTLIKQGRIRGVVIGVRNGKTLVPADEPEAFLAREARLDG